MVILDRNGSGNGRIEVAGGCFMSGGWISLIVFLVLLYFELALIKRDNSGWMLQSWGSSLGFSSFLDCVILAQKFSY